MNEDIKGALDQSAEHRRVGNTLFALTCVFVAFFMAFGTGHQWLPCAVAFTGACGFAICTRREWEFEDQWATCAELWAQEEFAANWLDAE